MKIITKKRCKCSVCSRNLIEPEVTPESETKEEEFVLINVEGEDETATPTFDTPSTSSKPVFYLPREILDIIFSLARPLPPTSISRKIIGYYDEWKSFYNLNLVCQDWKECNSSERTKIMVVKSQKQLKAILKAFRKDYLFDEYVKQLILDVDLVGEKEETGVLNEVLEYCQSLEKLLTIGFGFRAISNQSEPTINFPRISSLLKFNYSPVDSFAPMTITSMLTQILPKFHNVEDIEISCTPTTTIYIPPGTIDFGSLDSSTGIEFDFLSLARVAAIFPGRSHLKCLTLQDLQISNISFIMFLSNLPNSMEVLHLVDIVSNDIIFIEHAEQLFETKTESNLKQFSFTSSANSNQFWTPASVFWGIISSFPKLETLLVRDLNLFLRNPEKVLPKSLVKLQIGSSRMVEVVKLEERISFILASRPEQLKKLNIILIKPSTFTNNRRKQLIDQAKVFDIDLSFSFITLCPKDWINETLALRLAMFNK